MEVYTIVYTMKGCPHCEHIKELLSENNLDFISRDIDENESEYEDFKKYTGSDYVPSLLIIEQEGEDLKPYFYVPDKDYNEINEAVEIVKKHNSKVI